MGREPPHTPDRYRIDRRVRRGGEGRGGWQAVGRAFGVEMGGEFGERRELRGRERERERERDQKESETNGPQRAQRGPLDIDRTPRHTAHRYFSSFLGGEHKGVVRGGGFGIGIVEVETQVRWCERGGEKRQPQPKDLAVMFFFKKKKMRRQEKRMWQYSRCVLGVIKKRGREKEREGNATRQDRAGQGREGRARVKEKNGEGNERQGQCGADCGLLEGARHRRSLHRRVSRILKQRGHIAQRPVLFTLLTTLVVSFLHPRPERSQLFLGHSLLASHSLLSVIFVLLFVFLLSPYTILSLRFLSARKIGVSFLLASRCVVSFFFFSFLCCVRVTPR
eukprot:Rhum_TRINITY_DN10822_c0_g1::Rhum_TRINITY_DN10822_c0_g1_i1::g.40631::m.40631